MCNDRNYDWNNYLGQNFNFPQLIQAMDLQIKPIDIKARVVKLLRHMFIDQEPRQREVVPIHCKIVELRKTHLSA